MSRQDDVVAGLCTPDEIGQFGFCVADGDFHRENMDHILVHVKMRATQERSCFVAHAQDRCARYIALMTTFAPKLPTLFVSHGAPNMVLHDSPARAFLKGLGASLPRPDAILVMSAHFETREPFVVADEKPETIYDFGGFEQELYSMRYDAPGAMALASEAAKLAQGRGLAVRAATGRGYDHGTWVPLILMYPEADIPVAQISVQPRENGAHHAELGKALGALREQGVLVVGSGGLTHNLRAYFQGRYAEDAPAPDWVADFDEWVRDRAEAGDLAAIADYDRSGPHARDNHPSPEHFLPFPFAFGAAGDGAKGERIHTSHQNGVLMLDAYKFE
jgi:4,5-DOPA dioxygenase extradiol